MTATAGKALTVTVWARDDGKSATSVAGGGRGAMPVTLTWFKHQGPGAVAFTPPTARIPATGGSAPTEAVFSEPGDVRAPCPRERRVRGLRRRPCPVLLVEWVRDGDRGKMRVERMS